MGSFHKDKKGNTGAWIVAILIVVIIIFSSDKINISSIKSDIASFASSNSITKGLNNQCPQIDMEIKESFYGGYQMVQKDYDGWTLKSEGHTRGATCRKGVKEGENLNYYYCGGFIAEPPLELGIANAYIIKTDISEEGEIGETYSHIIWNIYDENFNFIETRCLGDLESFHKRREDKMAKYLAS